MQGAAKIYDAEMQSVYKVLTRERAPTTLLLNVKVRAGKRTHGTWRHATKKYIITERMIMLRVRLSEMVDIASR